MVFVPKTIRFSYLYAHGNLFC